MADWQNQSTSVNANVPYEPTADNTKVTLYSILLVWSLLGNVLVIAVVGWNNNIKNHFNCLILNMAVSDIFVPILALPLAITRASRGRSNEWLIDGPLGEALCKLCYFLVDISPGVSIFSLVIIAVNRFIAIVFPAVLKKWDKKTNTVLIILTWVVAMLLFSPYFYIFRLTNTNGFTQCISVWTPAFEEIPARMLFTSIIIITVFMIPLAALIVLYGIMLRKLVQNSKNVGNSLDERNLCSRNRRNKKIFYLSVTTVVAFLILWAPFFSFLFTINFIWRWKVPYNLSISYDTIIFAFQYLGYFNSAVNPCIYFTFLKGYRQDLKKIFIRKSSNTMQTRKTDAEKMNFKVTSI